VSRPADRVPHSQPINQGENQAPARSRDFILTMLSNERAFSRCKAGGSMASAPPSGELESSSVLQAPRPRIHILGRRGASLCPDHRRGAGRGYVAARSRSERGNRNSAGRIVCRRRFVAPSGEELPLEARRRYGRHDAAGGSPECEWPVSFLTAAAMESQGGPANRRRAREGHLRTLGLWPSSVPWSIRCVSGRARSEVPDDGEL
jgi:hypothetical protein